MGDSTNPRTQAIAALAELFFESACRSADLAQLESSAIDIGPVSYTHLDVYKRQMQQAARISDMCAFFLLGDLVEYGDTQTLFSHPVDKRTDDYITGRFG